MTQPSPSRCRIVLLWLALLPAGPLACSDTDPSPGGGAGSGGSGSATGGRGGSGGRGGAGGSGATAGTGGSAGSGGSSMTGSGGQAGSAGDAGGGDAPSGNAGSDGSDAAPGDGASGDAMGGDGAGEAGGAPAVGVKKSAGCGKPRPATLPTTFMTGGRNQTVIVSVPPTYDPNTAYPLAFGFHGAGLQANDCRGGNCAGMQRVMGDKALLVFMKSIGFNWEGGNRADNVTFFTDMLAYMKQTFCVDENRVVVAGSSSGATFSNILACRFGDQIRVAAPVAGSVPERTNCKGNPGMLVVHGVSDNFATGEGARNFWAMHNGCAMETQPPMAAEIAKVRTARMSRQEIHACSSYVSCTGAPVRFCAHSVGGYDGSTHGWPPVGGQLIWDFLQEQK